MLSNKENYFISVIRLTFVNQCYLLYSLKHLTYLVFFFFRLVFTTTKEQEKPNYIKMYSFLDFWVLTNLRLGYLGHSLISSSFHIVISGRRREFEEFCLLFFLKTNNNVPRNIQTIDFQINLFMKVTRTSNFPLETSYLSVLCHHQLGSGKYTWGKSG